MVLIEKYRQKLLPCGQIRWWTLVRCDNCGKERSVSLINIRNHIGDIHCKSCARSERCGYKAPFFGGHHSIESRQKIGKACSGSKHYLFGKHLDEERRLRLCQPRPHMCGRGNHKWNPDLTNEDRERRHNGNNVELCEWRRNVLRRDYWTCQITGDRCRKPIVHHLYSWANYKDKRYDIHNGITIREDLHRLFHYIYGYGHNTPDQFFEFCEYMHYILHGDK